MVEVDAKKLRSAILSRELNCAELAKVAGVSSSTLTVLKRRNGFAHYDTVFRLAKALDVAPHELVCLDSEKE